MRSSTVTALIAAGMLGLTPNASAATDPHPQPSTPSLGQVEPRPQPAPHYLLNITGQATRWRVSPGELEVVRWTLYNAGARRLEHVQLAMTVPPGWIVREGQGCVRRGQYLGCDVGSLEAGREGSVVVPMIAQRPFGPVRITAWSRASVGQRFIFGPSASFRVWVSRR